MNLTLTWSICTTIPKMKFLCHLIQKLQSEHMDIYTHSHTHYVNMTFPLTHEVKLHKISHLSVRINYTDRSTTFMYPTSDQIRNFAVYLFKICCNSQWNVKCTGENLGKGVWRRRRNSYWFMDNTRHCLPQQRAMVSEGIFPLYKRLFDLNNDYCPYCSSHS